MSISVGIRKAEKAIIGYESLHMRQSYSVRSYELVCWLQSRQRQSPLCLRHRQGWLYVKSLPNPPWYTPLLVFQKEMILA